MTSRRTSASARKSRRASPQQIIITVVGLLVIFAFILGMLSS